MRGWSFPIGRLFGVELRIHMLFLLLLAFSITYATFLGVNGGRGIALWLMLLLAVAIRETGRALASAWLSLDPRSMLILPTGSIAEYSSEGSSTNTPFNVRLLAATGPASNLLFGLILGAVVLTFAPSTDLRSLRWIDPVHLLRTLAWSNIMLAVFHCIPAWPLDAGKLLRSEFVRRNIPPTSRFVQNAATVGPSLGIGMILGGLASVSLWMIVIGLSLFLANQIERQSAYLHEAEQGGVPALGDAKDIQITMRDVMLTDYTVLSASATLEDAMRHAGHTLQDVYPVVRSGNLVGAVSRQTIVDALLSNGNGYVQGIMTRNLETAAPTDVLVATLRRIMNALAAQGAQLVPVVEDERVVGIITPQNLQRSMTMLNQTRRMKIASRLRDDN